MQALIDWLFPTVPYMWGAHGIDWLVMLAVVLVIMGYLHWSAAK